MLNIDDALSCTVNITGYSDLGSSADCFTWRSVVQTSTPESTPLAASVLPGLSGKFLLRTPVVHQPRMVVFPAFSFSSFSSAGFVPSRGSSVRGRRSAFRRRGQVQSLISGSDKSTVVTGLSMLGISQGSEYTGITLLLLAPVRKNGPIFNYFPWHNGCMGLFKRQISLAYLETDNEHIWVENQLMHFSESFSIV